MTAPLLYSVLLMQEYSLSDIAKVFACHKKILQPDAVKFAKGRWGFLAEGVSEEEARAMQRAAEACGVSAKVIPDGRLIAPPEIRSASLVSLGADGFEIKLKDGKQGTVAFAGVGVLAVYAWYNRTSSTEVVVREPTAGAKLVKAGILLTTGIPLSGKKVIVEQTTEVSTVEFFLDLILKQPLVRLRIDGQTQSYGLLKERMLHGVNSNFRVLFELMASKVDCLRNRGADLLLAGKPVAQMGYMGPKDADSEMRWLLTLLREARM